MLLQKESTGAKVNIKSYQAGEIKLNIGSFNEVILLTNGDKKDFSGASRFEQLNFDHLKDFLDARPEILIIGTGNKHKMLPIEITRQVNSMGIAVEAMASRQACHTYQVLTYEQRIIYALIFP